MTEKTANQIEIARLVRPLLLDHPPLRRCFRGHVPNHPVVRALLARAYRNASEKTTVDLIEHARTFAYASPLCFFEMGEMATAALVIFARHYQARTGMLEGQ